MSVGRLAFRSFAWLPLAASALLLPPGAPPEAGGQKKAKPEEIVQLQLDSIGSEEARASRKAIVARGNCNLIVLAGKERLLAGDASFLSQGKSYRSSLRFPVSDYPAEDLSFDGKKTYVGMLNPGQRSRIGQFIYDHDAILKEGLLGGVSSTAWPLLEIKTQKLKLKYAGKKIADDQEVHQLTYQMRKGDYDLEVSLFFDSVTYRHLATVYKLEIPDAPGMVPGPTGSPGARAADSPRRVSTRYTLEELFGDFRAVEGLTLPFRWKVRFTTEGPAADAAFAAATRDLSILEWDTAFETLSLNEAIDPKLFVLY